MHALAHGLRRFKRLYEACDLDEKPTYVEALRSLRSKVVDKHGAIDHEHDSRAVAQREELQRAGNTADNGSAFDRMRAAASRQKVAAQRAAADADSFELAAAAELQAAQRREAAEVRAKASQAALEALAPQPAQKKQKAAPQLDAEEAAEQAEPDAWESYSLAIFRALFRKFARTSRKGVDPANTSETLPAKGDVSGTRGWRHHAQHGMYGHVRHWADGSPHRVAYMLAELATYFNVVDAVRSRPPSAPSLSRRPYLLAPSLLTNLLLTYLYSLTLLRWRSGLA